MAGPPHKTGDNMRLQLTLHHEVTSAAALAAIMADLGPLFAKYGMDDAPVIRAKASDTDSVADDEPAAEVDEPKKRRGRKAATPVTLDAPATPAAAIAEAAPAPVAEAAQAPATVKAPAAPSIDDTFDEPAAPAAKAPDKVDLEAAFQRLIDRTGPEFRDRLKAILKPYNAPRPSAVPKDQWGKLIADMDAAS